MSDLRAQLESHPDVADGERGFPMMGGFARLRTVLDRERSRTAGPAFTVDGGDDFHGSGPAAWSRGSVVVKPLRALGFDVGVCAGGDLVHGAARFFELARGSGFARVGSGAALARGALPRFASFRRGGVKVTFVGITSAADGADDLRTTVADVRRDERPDLIVAVVRGGLAAARWIARAVPGLDVVLSGQPDAPSETAAREGKTVIVGARAFGSFVSRLDLTLGPGGVESHDVRLLPVRADVVREHLGVKAMVAAELAPFRERMRRVVGHTATPIVRDDGLETSADNLITDAIRESAGAQVAIAEPDRGGIPIPPGPITEGQLWDLVPADAVIEKGWATGRQLQDLLERQMSSAFAGDPRDFTRPGPPRTAGLEVTLTTTPPPGHRRVWSLHFAGAPVRHDLAYTMALYRERGDPARATARFREAQGVEPLSLTVHGALLRYLASHPVVRPRKEQRIAAIDVVRVARQDFGGSSLQSRSSSR